MDMSKKIVALFLAFMMLFAVVGCSTNDTANNTSNNQEATEETNKTGTTDPEESKNTLEGKTLNVVAAFSNKEEVFAKFTGETGIKVNFLDMSSGEVLSRVEAEGGKPVADLWFGGGVDSFISAANKGLLEAYASPEAEKIPAEFKDPEGYWNGIYLVITGFIVNNDVLTEKSLEAPKAWKDLTDSKYEGEIIMSNPAISGTNYAIVNSLLQSMGNEEGWKYLEGLGKNIPYFGKRGSEPQKKTVAGEYAVGITYVDGGIMNLPKEHPVSVIFPEDGIPWVPASMAIFKNAENLDTAKAFVDWALSVDGQQFISELNSTIMVRPEVPKPEILGSTPLDKLLDVDFNRFGSERDAVLDIWEKKVAK
jgi:iron(III) transport system substrate-binding protein